MIKGLSLREIDNLFEKSLKDCELICDIKLNCEDFIWLEDKFKEIFGNANEMYILNACIDNFRISISVLLVYEALYRYKHSYWDNILNLVNKNKFNEVELKDSFIFAFRKTIKSYNMRDFNDVGGYKNVTPIICHSGIPNYSLNTLFEITNEFISQSDISPEEIIENIKYFIRYKVDKSIYRFITKNEDRAKEFIYDIQILIRDIEEYNYSYEEAIEKFNFIENRIIDEYYLYKNTISNLDKMKNKRRKYLIQPKLFLNRFNDSICAKLPSNILKNGYDDTAEWVITIDNNEKIIKCAIFEENQEFITENKIVALLPGKKYEFKLIYEGDTIGKWKYEGFIDSTPFLLFDSNYNLIKSNRISDENIYIILKSACNIDEKEINFENLTIREKGWIGYKGYAVNFKEKVQDLRIYTNENIIEVIKYRDKKNIKLFGNYEVFKDDLIGNYVPIFSEKAPSISIDNVIDIDKTFYMTIRNIKNNINIKVPIVSENRKNELIITLNNIECFKEKIYGEYDVRIYSGKRLIKLLPFKFIPKIKVDECIQGLYPSEKGVYKKQNFEVITHDSLKIYFNELESTVDLNRDKNKYYFSNYSPNHFINGTIEMIYNNKTYSFNVRKKSRSLCYCIINEGDDLIKYQKEPSYVLLKDLMENNKVLALSFMDEYNDFFQVQCILEDCSGNELQISKYTIINNKIKFIPLNEFYDTIKKSTSNIFNIKITIKDRRDVILCNFIPCRIKEEVLISKVKYSEINNNIVLSWTGEGINTDNNLVLKIYDLLKPWIEPICININKESLIKNGKRFTLYLNKDEYSLENGTIYYFDIQEEKDDFFDDYDKNKILIFKKEGMYALNVDSNINYCDDIKTIISYVIKTEKKEDLLLLLNIIKKFKINETIEKKIILSLYFLHANSKLLLDLNKEERNLKFKCIYTLCKRYFYKCNIYLIISILMKYDNFENIKKLLNYINVFNLDRDIKTTINKEDRELLWKADKERGFLVETRSGISSKTILIKNIFDLIGDDLENKILKYSKECEYCKYKGNKGCVSQFIKRRCNKRKLNLSENLIGSSNQYEVLFEKYDYDLNQKALDSLKWINDVGDTGVVILGDTYVNSLFKWAKNTNQDKKDEISKSIDDKFIDLNNIIKKLTLNKDFNEFHRYLLKRKQQNRKNPNTLAYYNGVIVLISSMIKYKRIGNVLTDYERKLILNLVFKFRNIMYEIYLRDLIIIEFYLMQGEDLYVDGSN